MAELKIADEAFVLQPLSHVSFNCFSTPLCPSVIAAWLWWTVLEAGEEGTVILTVRRGDTVDLTHTHLAGFPMVLKGLRTEVMGIAPASASGT